MLILAGMMQACNLPKLARKEGPFLFKNKIEVTENQEARLFTSNLDDYIKQRPNKRLLYTARFGLRSYKFGLRYGDSWLGRSLTTKLGEAPVIVDSSLIEASLKGMKGYLKTQGYYYASVNYLVKGRIHKKKVVYQVTCGKPYSIYRTELHVADKKLDSLILSQKEFSHLVLGNRMYFENMLKEKNRISDLFRNNGYFSFQKDLIVFDVDTAMGDFHANVATNINNPENFGRFKKYKVNQITIEIEKEKSDTFTTERDSIVLRDFNYKPNNFPLNPEILERVVLLEPNKIFKNENANNTFSRINELQLFKGVNMNAVAANENTDTPGVNYYIKLQPSKKYDFVFEPQAITSDQANLVSSTGRNYGLASQFTLSNKNIFHNAEILQLTYRISIEAQRGPSIPKRPIFNSFESNLSASLLFPKLLFLPKLDRRWVNSTNRSTLTATTIWEKNVDWIRNVYGLSFSWQKNKKFFNQYFVPSEISYIKTDFNNKDLEEQSKDDPYLQSVFSNNLVTGTRYGFIYNNQADVRKKHFTYIKWDVMELAGTMIDLAYKLFNIPPSDSGYNTFLGVQYFQYAKTLADLRYNRYLDGNNRLASRFLVGVALPFGNSPNYVPFDKRFFTGGANSIRAFLPRSIGPGAYDTTGSLDRSGDIRLEFNVEHRFNILNHTFEGAIFVDAGNIWRIKDDGRHEALFTFKTFHQQLAVGAGLGLRLNLDFLILRLDAAIPLFDPRKPFSSRYVFAEYKDLGLLWENLVFNFGVGYPF